MALKQYSAVYCKHYNTPIPICENEVVNHLLQRTEGLSRALLEGRIIAVR